jgi:multidrug efflux pump subunit AcrB
VSPEVVESEVTKKIEKAELIAGISFKPRSYEGQSVVIIEFQLLR